jgi:hypothetical protein
MAEQKTSSTTRPSNSPVVLAVVVMAVAGLVGLNVMSNQVRPKTDHEIEAEQRERAKAAASPTPAAASPAPAGKGEPSAMTSSDPNSLVLAGEGNTLGSPSASQEVVIGFSWTPEIQADPSKVSGAVAALQQTLGSQGRIKVVNVDASPEVPEGVSIGGKVIAPAQNDGTIAPSAVEAVKKALATAP